MPKPKSPGNTVENPFKSKPPTDLEKTPKAAPWHTSIVKPKNQSKQIQVPNFQTNFEETEKNPIIHKNENSYANIQVAMARILWLESILTKNNISLIEMCEKNKFDDIYPNWKKEDLIMAGTDYLKKLNNQILNNPPLNESHVFKKLNNRLEKSESLNQDLQNKVTVLEKTNIELRDTINNLATSLQTAAEKLNHNWSANDSQKVSDIASIFANTPLNQICDLNWNKTLRILSTANSNPNIKPWNQNTPKLDFVKDLLLNI